MPRRPKTYVFDSWAIVAFLQAEPGGAKVIELIAEAQEHGIEMLMSVVNAAEVWYIKARRSSASDADTTIRELRQLGIHFIEAGWELAQEAGRFKAKNKMSFADCFAAALAKNRKATLVTGDPEFKQVESEVAITWLTTGKR